VQTDIQSGTIVFDCDPAERATFAECVGQKLSEALRVQLKMTIWTHHEFKKIIENYHLSGEQTARAIRFTSRER